MARLPAVAMRGRRRRSGEGARVVAMELERRSDAGGRAAHRQRGSGGHDRRWARAVGQRWRGARLEARVAATGGGVRASRRRGLERRRRSVGWMTEVRERMEYEKPH